MKLSKAQERDLNRAKEKIDKARKYSNFDDYYINELNGTVNDRSYDFHKKSWENAINGIVILHHSTKPTLLKLETLGLIKILNFDNWRNGNVGVLDTIQVLNY